MLSKIKKYVFTSSLQYYSRAKYIKNWAIYTLIYQSYEASSSFILHSQKSITISHFSHIGVIPLPASVAIRSRSSVIIIVLVIRVHSVGISSIIVHHSHSSGSALVIIIIAFVHQGSFIGSLIGHLKIIVDWGPSWRRCRWQWRICH